MRGSRTFHFGWKLVACVGEPLCVLRDRDKLRQAQHQKPEAVIMKVCFSHTTLGEVMKVLHMLLADAVDVTMCVTTSATALSARLVAPFSYQQYSLRDVILSGWAQKFLAVGSVPEAWGWFVADLPVDQLAMAVGENH